MNGVEDAVCLGVPGPGHGGGLALLQVGQHQEGQQGREEHRGHELGAADAEPALPGRENIFVLQSNIYFAIKYFYIVYCVIYLSSWLFAGGRS